jgi:hypothetical protein
VPFFDRLSSELDLAPAQLAKNENLILAFKVWPLVTREDIEKQWRAAIFRTEVSHALLNRTIVLLDFVLALQQVVV